MTGHIVVVGQTQTGYTKTIKTIPLARLKAMSEEGLAPTLWREDIGEEFSGIQIQFVDNPLGGEVAKMRDAVDEVTDKLRDIIASNQPGKV